MKLSYATIWLFLLAVWLLPRVMTAQVIINEIDADQVSIDAGEFIELYDGGVGNTSLTGLVVVFFNGGDMDRSYAAYDLDGYSTDANGYFVLGNAGVAGVDLTFSDNFLQNGQDAVALYMANGSDFPNLTPVTTANLIDAVVYGTDDPDDAGLQVLLNAGQPQLNEDANNMATTQSLQRLPNGTGGARNTSTYGAATPTPDAPNGVVSAPQVTITASDAGAVEDGMETGSFTISRTGSTSQSLTVTYTIGGTADNGVDYTPMLSGSVMIPMGSSSVVITITPVDDGMAEGNETVILTLVDGASYDLGAETEATVTIADEAPPMVMVIINEIDADQTGTDMGEFVELYDGGVGNTSLSGLVVVFYNGSNDLSYAAYDLDGFSTDANGYFILGNAAVPGVDIIFASNGLQNGQDAVALYMANGSDFPNNTAVTTTNLVDAIVYDTGQADDATLLALLNPSQPQVNENENGMVLTQSLQRLPNGTGGKRNTDTYSAADPTPNAPNGAPPPGTGVTIAATDANAAEQGQDPGTFTISRTGATTQDLTVTYTIGGSATNGTDYTPMLTGTVIIPMGSSSVMITITPVDDNDVEGNETATLTLVDGADYDLGSPSMATVTIAENDVILTPIYTIQGANHISTLAGQSVSTRGIVTAVANNGFYLQDATGDGNPATSDGIFVFTSSAPGVAVGSLVQVSGTVVEFQAGAPTDRNLTLTEITSPAVSTLMTGQPLPAATVLAPPTQLIDDDTFDGSTPDEVDATTPFDPQNDGIDYYESLEGMRVTVPSARATAPTNSFGEIWVVGSYPTTGVNSRGGITIRDGGVPEPINEQSYIDPFGNYDPAVDGFNNPYDDFNPERVQLDDALFAGNSPQVNVGATFGDVTGVVNYSFGNYEVLPTAPLTVQSNNLTREMTSLVSTEDQLTVAGFNVENLDPGDGADRFNALAGLIVNNLKSPDIIGLEEVQDNSGPTNNGITSADQTLTMLVNAISLAGGPTYAYIDNPFIGNNTNGGEGGGNIRVAYLYRPDRVELNGDPEPNNPFSGSVQTVINPVDQQTDPDHPFFAARPPLVAKFIFNDEREVTLINNHFSSKGGSTDLYENLQPSINGGENKREAQAEAVKAYVDNNPDEDIIVLGDLNDFQFYPPVEILAQNLTNLIETLAENERYTYNFDGNSQALDHMLASPALAAVAEFDIVHVNSEFVDQLSDHDPPLARFSLPGIPPVITQCQGGTIIFDGEASFPTADYVMVMATDNSDGPVTFSYDPEFIYCGQVGSVVPVTITATDAYGNSSTCQTTITVTGTPCGWIDSGGIGCSDNAGYNPVNGTFSLQTQGCNFVDPRNDRIGFLYQSLCGNGTLTLRVASVTSGGFAGLALRTGLEPNAIKVDVVTSLTTQLRSAVRTYVNEPSYPFQSFSGYRNWLRLVRTGNLVQVYISQNGQTWTLLLNRTLNLPNCVLVGMVAYGPGTTTATFDNVSFTGGQQNLVGAPGRGVQSYRGELMVYPNPTTGMAMVNLPAGEVLTDALLEVQDGLGRTLRQLSVDGEQQELNLYGLAPGMYFVRLQTKEGRQYVQRLILQARP